MTYTEGDRERDEAIAGALHAERLAWKELYADLENRYVIEMADGTEFIGEDLRLHAEENGLGKPHHHNVWGACARSLISKWLAKGIIIVAGWRKAATPRAHSRTYKIYRRVRTA